MPTESEVKHAAKTLAAARRDKEGITPDKKGSKKKFENPPEPPRKTKKGWIIGLCAVVALAGIGVGAYYLVKLLNGNKVDLTKAKIQYEEFNGGYRVVGITNENKSLVKTISVPSEYNGKPVVEIKEGALGGCGYLEEVTLPFIGKSADAIEKEGLFGYIFGNEMSEGAGAYTYQFYFKNGEEVDAQFCIPQNLNYVTINGGKVISSGAFSNCKYIQSIVINNNTTTKIEDHAFYYCSSLYEFKIPNKVTEIGEKAFERNYDLAIIDIPNGVTTLKTEAFGNCISAAMINIPKSVVTIEENCFINLQGGVILVEATSEPEGWEDNWAPKEASICYGLDNVVYADNYLSAICSDGESNTQFAHLLQWTGKWQIGEVNIPDNLVTSKGTYPIKVIGASLFSDNTTVKSITIGKHVEKIAAKAFYNCNKLKSFTFDNNEEGEGEDPIDTPLKYIGVSAFEKCSSLEGCMIKGIYKEGVRIPKHVTDIESRAFNSCSHITRLGLPEEIVNIGDYAFENCERLIEGYDHGEMDVRINPDTQETIKVVNERAVYLHKSITNLGEGAFKNCFRLKDDGTTTLINPMFVIENEAGIQGFPKHVFENCGVRTTDGIHSRKIRIDFNLGTQSEGAKVFDDYSFSNCYMNYFTVRNENLNKVGNYAFYNAYPNMPAGVKICHNVTSIGEYAFYNWNTVAGITLENTEALPSQLKTIGQYAFYNCSHAQFTELLIPDCVVSIGRYAFCNCSKVEKLHLPKNETEPSSKEDLRYTQISYACFQGMTNLGRNDNELYIPNTVVDLDSACFQNCANLVKVTVGGGESGDPQLTRVSWSVFAGCTSLEEVDWNLAKVTSFSSSIFSGCSSLNYDESKTLTTTSITSSMYANCTSLTSIDIKTNITSIADSAFKGCSKLANVNFEGDRDKNISLARASFQDCKALERIGDDQGKLPKQVSTINDLAFSGCTTLGTAGHPFQLPVDRNSITLGVNVFEKWTSNQTIYFTSKNMSGDKLFGKIALEETVAGSKKYHAKPNLEGFNYIGSSEVFFEDITSSQF